MSNKAEISLCLCLLMSLLSPLSGHEQSQLTQLSKCICSRIVLRVCGENGRTFKNACEAGCKDQVIKTFNLNHLIKIEDNLLTTLPQF